MEDENGKLKGKTGEFHTLLEDDVKEKNQLIEAQLSVAREEEQRLLLRKEIEDKMKIQEEERESSSDIIHELSLEVS